MAELNQIQDASAIFVGWYGTCENDTCQDFPLTPTLIRAKIQKVFQTSIAPNNDGYLSFDGTIDPTYDNDLQSFTKLECGKSYIIVLKPGVGSLIIDEFSYTDGGSDTAGLVTQECKPNPTPTPLKPTPTPEKPTPTPKDDNTDCNCADDSYKNVVIAGSLVPSNGHQFGGFPIGSVLSYADDTLKTEGIACQINFMFPNNTDAGMIVLNGKVPNETEFILKYGNTCYSALANNSNKSGDEWNLVMGIKKTLDSSCGQDLELPTPPPQIDPTPTPEPEPTPTPTPEMIKLTSPLIAGLEDAQTNSLTLNVDGIDENADIIKIEISLDSDFTNILRVDSETANSLIQSKLDFIPNLSPGTMYYIRLIATANGYLDSDYSTTFSALTLEELTPTPTPEKTPTPTPEKTPTPTPEQPEDCCANYENNVEIENTSSPITFRGITISGFQQNGIVCIDEINQDAIPEKSAFWFGDQSATWFGSVNTDYPVINNKIRYTDPNGVCYEGELNTSPPNGQYNILTEI